MKKTLLIDVTVDKMKKQFIASHADMMADDDEFALASGQSFVDGLTTLINRDVTGIRKMFRDGVTFTLVDICKLDTPIATRLPLELRVWDGDDLIMVLTDKEVNY